MSEEVNDEENTCGVFSMDIPQDLYVLTRTNFGSTHVMGVFCNPDYAKLYGKWLKEKRFFESCFEIHKTRGNPGKETINDYV